MNYSNIRKFDIANGEGIRITLFVSGCQFHCPGCFNQEAWDYFNGQPYTQNTRQFINDFLSNPNITGLSILGGDPLWQDENGLLSLIELCKDAHALGKDVWIWSGFTYEQIFPVAELDQLDMHHYLQQELIRNCDIWVDGPFIESEKDITLKWCGSSNQRVIDVQKTLEANKIIISDKA